MRKPSEDQAPKARTPASSTRPVTLRVREDHIKELDKIAAGMGIIRSAAIQIAIAEFVNGKK